MKTAISLPDELFDEIEACARRLELSCSRLFARAAREFLACQARHAEMTCAAGV